MNEWILLAIAVVFSLGYITGYYQGREDK